MGPIYFAEVVDFKSDPSKTGRCKIRFYPNEGMNFTNEQSMPDDQLPYAMPLMNATSASTGKIGTIPTGLIKGSRVAVTFASGDTNKQYPIIIGSFPRGFEPVTSQYQSDSEQDGLSNVNRQTAGIDVPYSGNPNPNGGRENIGRTSNPRSNKQTNLARDVV